MKTLKIFGALVFTGALFFAGGCGKGCTDPKANNYDADVNRHEKGSCEYDELNGDVAIQFHAMLGNEEIAVNQVVTTSEGYQIRIGTFKFYVSDVRLSNANSEQIINSVGIVDFKPDNLVDQVSGVVNPDTYTTLTFDLGLSPDQNGGDPAQFGPGEPLGIDFGMFWDWSAKYLFVKFDGQSDTTGTNSQFNHNFVYHCGRDDFREKVTLTPSTEMMVTGEGVSQFDVFVDVERFFAQADNPVDIKTENSTHTMNNVPLAQKFHRNVARSFSMN